MSLNPHYILIKQDPNNPDNPKYWNNEAWDWMPEEEDASVFDESILTLPLPYGTSMVTKKHIDNEYDYPFCVVSLPDGGRVLCPMV